MDMVNTTELIKKYGLRLTKSLGQNFLTDINIIKKIVEAGEVTGDDLVLEIGPGIGSMTIQLAQTAGRVIAIEIDKHLIPALEEVLVGYSNTTVVHADAMKVDMAPLIVGWNGPLKVISNLPYYITTPLIMRLLESDIPWDTLVFMVQKEVAIRIAANPGGKDYSSLSVAVKAHANPKMAFTVSRNCFVPRPDVDSAVVVLKKVKRKELEVLTKNQLFTVVRAAFGQRRKTILNALAGSAIGHIGKEKIRELLQHANIAEIVRAETLSLEKFVDLAVVYAPYLGNAQEEDTMDMERCPVAGQGQIVED